MKTTGARKTALVTGASSGIGEQLARLLAGDGHDLVLVARDTARLEALAAELARDRGVAAVALAADLSDPSSAEAIFGELGGRGIEIDVLVNAAGFNVSGPYWQTDAAEELRMLHVLVETPSRLAKLALPGMLRRGFGRILNVGSTGSFAPGPMDAVYCASKAYVLSLSEALAEELAGTGVTVTALCPGPTRTRFAERAGMADTPLFRKGVMTAEDVAAAGYRAMVRGRRVVVPGLANRLQAFAIRFAPRRMVAATSKRLLSRPAPAAAPGTVLPE